ncbi:MAG TPA: AAA family ATPase [Streptosporangiaceae bacterium]|nr:AAA family ATPase [Streptosporangiaceae bacterium]
MDLLERDAEMAALYGAFNAAATGTGSLIVVEAGPGMGKTVLLGHAGRMCRDAGLTVFRARGAELEQVSAFGAVRQLLDPFLGMAGEHRDELLTGAAAKCTVLFEPVSLGSDQGSHGLFGVVHGLYWLITNLTMRGPIALLIDDAHWCDSQSLEFLGFLLRRIETLPVSIVLTTRPEGMPAHDRRLTDLICDPAASVIELRPLSMGALRGLIGQELGHEPDDAFCEACHEVTRGNPLYATELLRGLAADGVVPTEAAVTAVRSAGPGAVARYVRARVGLLSAQGRRLAEAVAVLGDDVGLAVAADLARVGDRAAELAEGLVQRGVFARVQPPAFTHPLVREAVYQAMASASRSHAHERAAELLAAAGCPAEQLASHVLHTAPQGDAGRLAILLEAARLILKRGVPEGAVAYLRRARAEPPGAAQRSEVSRKLGNCEAYCLDFASAGRHLREALRLASSPAEQAACGFSLARLMHACGRPAEAVDLLLTASSRLRHADEPLLAIRIEAELLGFARVATGRRELVLDRLTAFEQNAASGHGIWAPYGDVLDAHRAIEEALTPGGNAQRAKLLARRALAARRLRPDLSAAYVAVHAMLACDDLDGAERSLEHGLAIALDLGQRLPAAAIECYLSKVSLLRGDLAEAANHVEAGLELAGGNHFAFPMLLSSRIEILIEQGDLDGADLALAESGLNGNPRARLPQQAPAEASGSRPPQQAFPESCFFLWLLYARGRLRFARGDFEHAVSDFSECGTIYRRWAPCLLDLPWRSRASAALARLGRLGEAAALVTAEVELARSFGAHRPLGVALTAAAALADRETGIELLGEAIAVLERSQARLELAKAADALGAALSADGQRQRSRHVSRRALRLALECRATALAAEIRARLAAGGGRPPRVWVTGVHSLTPSERRVAMLAARQLTSRQIAEQLYITEKTVEAHLSRVYRKLQVSSRWQLRGKLGDLATDDDSQVGAIAKC